MARYFRLDMDNHEDQHVALFAETNDNELTIFQQFAIALEAPIADVEHCKLSTITHINGKVVNAIDAKLGWRQISGDEWEGAVELKRQIYYRDCTIARSHRPPCAHCGGKGIKAQAGGMCIACAGTGRLP